MKVLQILHTDESGGIRTLAGMIADGIRSHGILVETKYLYPPGDSSTLTKLLAVIRGGFEIAVSSADVLISYQTTASILCGTFGRVGRYRRRIAHQTAMPWVSAGPLAFIEKCVGMVGGYTANIMNSRATAAAYDGYPASYRKYTMLIEHGVMPRAPQKCPLETRKAFGLPLDSLLLINVGRLTAQKNQQVVIKALKALPDVHLAIVGGGELEKEYSALADTYRISGRIHFLGDLLPQDIADLLHASNVFVFPSTWETFGLAGVEAAIAGLPIISSDLPVLREVLGSVESAPVMFVPPFAVSRWSEAIERHLAMRPNTSIYKQAMAQRFSAARMIEKYIDLLHRE